uniref:Transmembrane protein 45A n=1 Tax=Crocodylus porosus TaxID=8502 RepID=A0A7M4E3S7_CROPO
VDKENIVYLEGTILGFIGLWNFADFFQGILVQQNVHIPETGPSSWKEMSWFRDFPRKRILGMIAEQFVPDGLCVKLYNYKENHWDHLMNWQHVTMCLFYSISGFLFYYYKHGRATLDLHVHQLLLGAIFGVSICIFLEVFFHGSIVTIRLRTSLCILQGSWLWQIVFVLYPPNGIPEGNQMDHNNMLFLTMCCCWHYAFAFLILAVNYTVIPFTRLQRPLGEGSRVGSPKPTADSPHPLHHGLHSSCAACGRRN